MGVAAEGMPRQGSDGGGGGGIVREEPWLGSGVQNSHPSSSLIGCGNSNKFPPALGFCSLDKERSEHRLSKAPSAQPNGLEMDSSSPPTSCMDSNRPLTSVYPTMKRASAAHLGLSENAGESPGLTYCQSRETGAPAPWPAAPVLSVYDPGLGKGCGHTGSVSLEEKGALGKEAGPPR